MEDKTPPRIYVLWHPTRGLDDEDAPLCRTEDAVWEYLDRRGYSPAFLMEDGWVVVEYQSMREACQDPEE